MFVKKYRQHDFDKIIGLPERIKKLVGNDMPHLMFYGKQGTGKSLTSEAIQKFLGWETLHLNGSDSRSINDVRDVVKSFMMCKSTNGMPKLVRYEEFDFVSKDGQAMLRELLETYVTNCRVIFTLNYPNKVLDPLKSRCVVLNMDDKDNDDIFNHLKTVCESENIEFEDDALKVIIEKYSPDIRSCLNKLEEISRIGKVTKDKIVIDEEKILELFELIKLKNFNEARLWCLNSNRESSELLHQLFKVCMKSDLEGGKKLKFIENLAETDYRMGLSTDKEVQMSAGIVRLIRSLM